MPMSIYHRDLNRSKMQGHGRFTPRANLVDGRQAMDMPQLELGRASGTRIRQRLRRAGSAVAWWSRCAGSRLFCQQFGWRHA